MRFYAVFRNFVVTARPDGSIPPNALIVTETVPGSGESGLLAELIEQANGAADQAALAKADPYEPPK